MTESNEYTASQEELLGLVRQYIPSTTLVRPKDIVSERYRILTNQVLPDLSSQFATAYAVQDEQNPDAGLYALVYNSGVPLRQKNMDILKDFIHPNMVSLLASGLVEISILSEVRTVAVLEKPVGQSLSQILSEGRHPVSQAILVNYVLRPLVEVLRRFEKAGISHNRINLKNVYVADSRVILGECISEPAGFSQDFLFEPIERNITLPTGKSDYDIHADCYAVAVLALHLTIGFQPFVAVDKEKFVENIMTQGSFHVLAARWDFSDELQDFFRGLLNDARRERWDTESLENWLSGRRFNLIIPSAPNEGSRGFDFMGRIYYNRKAIANAIFSGWQDTRVILSDTKLGRWIETSVHKPDLSEAILRIAANSNLDNVRYERGNNESLARTIILLDPTGPIRFRHVAVMLEGIGNFLAGALLSDGQDDIQAIMQMLEGDLPWFWLEQQGAATDYTQISWKLQKVRSFTRINSIGFSVERCVYEMHPGMPCQSKLIKRYHATTLREMMIALDMCAAQRAAQDDFIDRHIAAFITSKLEIGKEVRVTELDVIPNLSMHTGLIGLKLLIKAQNKVDISEFYGLCAWVAMKLMPLVGTIHKRSVRKAFRKDLMAAVASGRLRNISNLLLNPAVFVTDHNDFYHALAVYKHRKQQIAELNNPKILMRHSRMAGRGIAQIISYGVCLTTVYYTLKAYLHF